MLTVDKSTKFDWKNIPFVQCSEGNAMDTYFTLKVYGRLLEELQGKGLETLYEKLISPLTIAFRDIEFDGLLIDEDKVASLKSELETKFEEAEVTYYNQTILQAQNNENCD